METAMKRSPRAISRSPIGWAMVGATVLSIVVLVIEWWLDHEGFVSKVAFDVLRGAI